MDPRIRDFYDRGLKFVASLRLAGTSEFPTIRPAEPAWLAWEDYFRWLGVEPSTMRMVRYKGIPSLTVPAELPELFDARYQPGMAPRRPAPKPELTPQRRHEMAEQLRRLGLKIAADAPNRDALPPVDWGTGAADVPPLQPDAMLRRMGG